MDVTYAQISKMIDHALLNPALTQSELVDGIHLAIRYDVASVCIMPFALKMCAEILEGTSVKPSTTIGFPHGGHAMSVKIREAEQAIEDGCQELDMVVNISKVVSHCWGDVSREIEEICKLTHAAERKLKVIFENCYLHDEHKIRLCRICSDVGVDWVKTSTGFGASGATEHDLKLMRANTSSHVQLKASGGIRDFKTVLAFRNLGVTRCGASGTERILDECRDHLSQLARND